MWRNERARGARPSTFFPPRLGDGGWRAELYDADPMRGWRAELYDAATVQRRNRARGARPCTVFPPRPGLGIGGRSSATPQWYAAGKDGHHDMERPLPQRKSPAHPSPIELDGRPTIVFLTVCTRNRRPLLANRQITYLLISWWRRADQWLVGRYVVMPDHIHLFCAPRHPDPLSLKSWVQFWKNRLTRDWPVEKDKPIWQRDFWDRQLRGGESYEQKWEYVRNNPCRHGLVERCEDWQFQGELNVLEWRG